MDILFTWLKGWRFTFQHKTMWLVLYLSNLIVALLATLPLFSLLESKLGNSIASENLLAGFDYTVYSDFMNEYGEAAGVVLGQSRILLLLFFLISVFLMGGILEACIKKTEQFKLGTFLANSSRHFWKMLRLSLYFFFFQGILIFIFGSIYMVMIKGGNLAQLETEVKLFSSILVLAPFYLLIATFLFMVHDYAKIHVLHRNKKWLTMPFWESFSIVFKNFRSTFSLYLLNILLFLAIAGIYYWISESYIVNTSTTLFLALIIGQLFLISRLGIKIINLASASILYKKIRNIA